jgi:polygalacturonase
MKGGREFMTGRWICVVLFVSVAAAISLAQDTRKVTEPVIPPACRILKAKIGRGGLSIMAKDESRPDTVRIQAAMDHCAPGHAVVLKPSARRQDAFLSGPLQLRKGVVLVVEGGAFLYASRNPRDYDYGDSPGVCGTITPNGHHCKALINGEGAADSGVMGDGVIDGRGGETILGKDVSWWNLADQARQGGSQNVPRLLSLARCDNFALYRITLMNSPNFHVGYDRGNGFTAWGVKIFAPERARNTDGIDPGRSTNVTITHSYIHTGDDQVAIKGDAGAPTAHMSIVHNHFYSGHGMSIGSPTEGGVSSILVSDLSIDGADNGLRIKSNSTRGGLVRDVLFEDVCIRDTAEPIVMDTSYSAHVSNAVNRPPTFQDIMLRNIAVQGAGQVLLEGTDPDHRLGIRFDNVQFADPAAITVSAVYADVKLGPGPFNLKVAGHDVKVTGTPGKAAKNTCAGKFVGFPVSH